MYYLFETSGCTISSHRIKSIILKVFFSFTFRAQSYDRKYFQKTLIIDFGGHILPKLHFFRFLLSFVNFKHEKFLCHEIHFKLYSNTLTCHNVVDKNRIFSSWEIENDFQFWKIYSLVFKFIHIICWLLAKTCTNILLPKFFLSLLKSIRI